MAEREKNIIFLNRTCQNLFCLVRQSCTSVCVRRLVRKVYVAFFSTNFFLCLFGFLKCVWIIMYYFIVVNLCVYVFLSVFWLLFYREMASNWDAVDMVLSRRTRYKRFVSSPLSLSNPFTIIPKTHLDTKSTYLHRKMQPGVNMHPRDHEVTAQPTRFS